MSSGPSGKGSPEARKRAAAKYYRKHAERLKAIERERYRKKFGGLKRDKKAHGTSVTSRPGILRKSEGPVASTLDRTGRLDVYEHVFSKDDAVLEEHI